MTSDQERHINRIVANWPALTEQQRAKIAQLMPPRRGSRPLRSGGRPR